MSNKPLCSIDGCNEPRHARGVCTKHWHTWAKQNPDKIRRYVPAIARWEARFTIEENGCWRWTGTIGSTGYGQISDKGVKHNAHRFGYAHFVGDPGTKHLDHLCKNRWCVNPAHLEPVTLMENLLRGDRSHLGRHLRERTHCPKGHEYTPENVWVNPKTNGRRCRKCAREKQIINYHRRRQAR